MLIVVEIKYGNKSEKKLSREEKFLKVTRFVSRQLIHATFTSRNVFFILSAFPSLIAVVGRLFSYFGKLQRHIHLINLREEPRPSSLPLPLLFPSSCYLLVLENLRSSLFPHYN